MPTTDENHIHQNKKSMKYTGGSERIRYQAQRDPRESSFSKKSTKTLGVLVIASPAKLETAPCVFSSLAEARGFEPPIHCCIHDFESCAFNHSATLPFIIIPYLHPKATCKAFTSSTQSNPCYFAVYILVLTEYYSNNSSTSLASPPSCHLCHHKSPPDSYVHITRW